MQWVKRNGGPCVLKSTKLILESRRVFSVSKDDKHQDRDIVTIVGELKLCARQKDLQRGSILHSDILRRGLPFKNVFIGNTLVNMYAKCGALAEAQQLFNKLPIQNVVSWNALIGGYVQQGHGIEALKFFELMQRDGFLPDAITFACILKGCANVGALNHGKEVHAEIAKEGLLGKDSVLGNVLVDMYAKLGALKHAQEVFDELAIRDVVSWNILIVGYSQHQWAVEALKCFKLMHCEGLCADAVTFSCILKVCGCIGAVEEGEELHDVIIKVGLLRNNVVIANALVDMYSKWGILEKAQEVLDECRLRNVVSWTALIAGYVDHGYGGHALICFERMQSESFAPDLVTFLCMLKACSIIGAIEKGNEIHAKIAKEGVLGKSILLGNGLVEMYVKCGAISKAQEVFDELPTRTVISWTALISGYASLGYHQTVFDLYTKMLGEGIKPDTVTFSVMLSVCCSSGLLDQGQMIFKVMVRHFSIVPTLEHQTCMVDLFSRSGFLDDAVVVIEKMAFSGHRPVWSTLLSACEKWGNVEIGRFAFNCAIQANQKSAGAYISMSNIYVASGMQEDADKIKAMRLKNEAL